MNHVKFYFFILMSILLLLCPVVLIMLYISCRMHIFLYLFIGSIVISLALRKPLNSLMLKYREILDYDDLGRSKAKGTFQRLSKKERQRIELEQTVRDEMILNSSELKKMTKKGSLNPEQDMEKLIGLESVKTKMKSMSARMEFESSGKKKKTTGTGSFEAGHMAFCGSPGTGKTTVARIMTGFLYKYGYISKNICVEVDGNYLKGTGFNEAARKTELLIRQAYGGVLFIDEAYSMMDGVGKETIATLLKHMEDDRNRFILILAGYTHEMDKLFFVNPGFRSRIKNILYFDDFTNDELFRILKRMAEENKFTVSESCHDLFYKRITEIERAGGFGNARTVRNILDEMINVHAVNWKEGNVRKEDRFRLDQNDF